MKSKKTVLKLAAAITSRKGVSLSLSETIPFIEAQKALEVLT